MQLRKDSIVITFPIAAWENISNPTVEQMYGFGFSDYTPSERTPMPPMPLSVAPRQIRQALTAVGMRELVEDAVAAADQDTKDWWLFATAFEENHSKIIEMCAALSITDDQRHAVFQLAASL